MTGRSISDGPTSGWQIRTAVPADLDMIDQLERLCFSDPWTPDALARDLSGQPRAFYTVAVRHDRVVGFCSWRNMVDTAEITRVAVRPDCRGQGIASALLRHMIIEVRSQSLPDIRLEMRRGNRAAQALYENAGFTAVAIRRNYYSHPDEDAIIMLKKLE